MDVNGIFPLTMKWLRIRFLLTCYHWNELDFCMICVMRYVTLSKDDSSHHVIGSFRTFINHQTLQLWLFCLILYIYISPWRCLFNCVRTSFYSCLLAIYLWSCLEALWCFMNLKLVHPVHACSSAFDQYITI